MSEHATNRQPQPQVTRKKLKPFDITQLRRYTFDDLALEKELLNLFQAQLPVLIARIETAKDQTEWRLATHTLKGSARSVGAPALAEFALEFEEMGYQPVASRRAKIAARLSRAAAAFSKAVGRAYRGA